MDKNDHINYWLETAKHDLDVAESLFNIGKYDYCLFIGHLILEKVLKAFWVRDNTDNFPPKIHNLQKLASQTKLILNSDIFDFLRIVNEFNIETRYPNIKFKFYKKCTAEFTSEWYSKIKEIYKWLLTQM
jgi:HEPN domain-containing protein